MAWVGHLGNTEEGFSGPAAVEAVGIVVGEENDQRSFDEGLGVGHVWLWTAEGTVRPHHALGTYDRDVGCRNCKAIRKDGQDDVYEIRQRSFIS